MASIDLFPRPEKLQTFPPSPILDSQELHVLAVDDSIIDRKVIERLLKISSCKVTAVDSGRRALQLLGLDGNNNSVGIDGLKVNLIITDYWMPGMTGYELLKKIKESSTFREIPVVIMSSENVLTRINRCLEEGAEEFLVKPVQLSDVKRLKDYIIREEFEGDEKKRSNNKRKLIQNSSTDLHLSSDSSPPLEASISSSSSDLSDLSSSSSSELSDSSSPSSDSSPPSPDLTPPSSLESPSRRFRQTNEYESL